MKNRLCIVLVILIFGTSLNRGQKIKSNERRAIGIFPYPRTGRHLAMASFARVDGNAGMVNYPRVGRSGSIINDDRNLAKNFSEPAVDGYRNYEPEIVEDFDFSGHRAIDYEESKKRLEALRNSGMWIGAPSAYGQGKGNQRMHRCSQQIDGPWAVLFATRDMTNLDQQPVNNFVPRSAREAYHEISATDNTAS